MTLLKVADYSWGRPSPAALVAAGFVGVVRYAPGRDSAVHITKSEADALTAAGLQVAIVIQPAPDFMLGGFDRGALEARRSIAMTDAAGLPQGDVYAAVDFDATGGAPPNTTAELAQLEKVAQTFLGVASVVGQDHVRPYAGYHALNWLYGRLPWLKPGWQPPAWSQVDGKVTYHQRLALIQHHPSITVAGGLIDHNDVLATDWGQRTTPAPQEATVYLTDLADVLRRAGLKVVEIPGWKTRGRPGDFNPIGVLCHHTGSANTGLSKEYGYANWMATVGRDDLKAPLAQLALGRDGTFYVMAAGRANHAGKCKLIAGLQPSYAGAGHGDGNEQLVGIEAMNNGIGEAWPTVQYRAYVRGVAAINARYGFPVKRTLAHRETSLSGKPDPVGINMTTFRSQVAAENLGAPAPARTTLRLGDRGEDVKAMQYRLNVHGATPALTADGSFGPATEAAVKAFQTAAAIPVDGIANPRTLAALSATPAPTIEEITDMTPDQLKTLVRDTVREVIREEATARAIWTTHRIVKDVRDTNPTPDDPTTRVTPSTLLEAAVVNAEDVTP